MSQASDDRLDSWKEIASYLDRDVRTLRRWEGERQLPIHRVPGEGRRAVFAFRSEIQAWLRKAEEKPQEGFALEAGQAKNGKAAEDKHDHAADETFALAGNPGLASTSNELRGFSKAKPLTALARKGYQAIATHRLIVVATIVTLVGAVTIVTALRSYSLKARGTSEAPFGVSSTDPEKVPAIFSVTPILAQAKQQIVIQGRGFGLHVPYARTDSPYLAIRDRTAKWAAGRMIPWNWDEVTLDVESWTDTQIIVNGFSGSYGVNGWKLGFADELEIAVWNPQSGAGPGLYRTAVVSTQAHR